MKISKRTQKWWACGYLNRGSIKIYPADMHLTKRCAIEDFEASSNRVWKELKEAGAVCIRISIIADERPAQNNSKEVGQ